jgi:hypothetical protein
MKIKKATVSEYQTVDGYDVTVYENVEVPDDFESMTDDERAEVFDRLAPVSNEFIVRKVFDSSYDGPEVTYEL